MTVDEATALVYNRIHADRYSNTFDTASDKGKWRSAIAELLEAINVEGQ